VLLILLVEILLVEAVRSHRLGFVVDVVIAAAVAVPSRVWCASSR
jgi:hypothetical protein